MVCGGGVGVFGLVAAGVVGGERWDGVERDGMVRSPFLFFFFVTWLVDRVVDRLVDRLVGWLIRGLFLA